MEEDKGINMDWIIKKASVLTQEEKEARGIVGIPDNWPIEKYPYTEPVPEGFEGITSADLDLLIANNQAEYDAWLQAKRPIIINPAVMEVKTVEGSYTTPTAPKNEHTLIPPGMVKGYFNAKDYSCSITLSNRNGRTFTFNNDVTFLPEEEYYVMDETVILRCEVESSDEENHTVTFSDGIECGCLDGADLPEGTYILSKPYEMFCQIPHIEGNNFTRELAPGLILPCCCFWGLMVDIDNYAKNDFVELGVECVDGIPDGQGGWIIPPGGWDLEYDYSWVRSAVKSGKITAHDADGAPGAIPETFYLRFKYFNSKIYTVDNFIECWVDFIISQKDPV